MASIRTRTFRSGNSEAVRLPREVAYGEPGLELEVTRTGDVVTLTPVKGGIKELVRRLRELPAPSYIQAREPFEAPDRWGDDKRPGSAGLVSRGGRSRQALLRS